MNELEVCKAVSNNCIVFTGFEKNPKSDGLKIYFQSNVNLACADIDQQQIEMKNYQMTLISWYVSLEI